VTRRPARRRHITIVEALEDCALFGGLPAFRDLSTWRAWLVFLRAVYGLPLDAAGEALFREHTGRSTYDPPAGGWREVVCVVGRQSGKTRIAASIAAFEAMTVEAEADGTELYSLLVAQDHRASLRAVFRYALTPFDRVPILRRTVALRRAEALTLDNGCVLAAYPCRPQSVRGLRARVVVCDELAFYRSSEGFPTDVEMLRAVRPCLATTDGRLVILSSPYAQSGALWELHRRHFGQDGALVLVWQASAPQMNPTLPADYLARMETDDPEAYRSEVLGEFRAGVSTLLDPDSLAAVVASGIRERAPEPGRRYEAFCDPASGSGKDAFTLALAHEQDGRQALDLVRAWQPSFNPSGVIAEAAELVKQYGLRDVSGDRYAPGFVSEGFRAHGVTYHASERDRSALFLELVGLVNSSRVLLLDDPELLRELRCLERRRGPSGRDRVDHRPGAHDDRANAAAGALVVAARGPRGAVSTTTEGSLGLRWRAGCGLSMTSRHDPLGLLQ
jgi:hypothetical protein